MRAWVFSDLHLDHPSSPLYQSFLKRLDEPQNSNDHVVFAGDIFDLWVGGSALFKLKYRDFLQAVEVLILRNVHVYYIEGNHDFHLRECFPAEVEFHPESVVLTDSVDSNPPQTIYIAHGDLVDEEDVSYLKLRGVLRSPLLKWLVSQVPGRLIQAIGETMSRPAGQKIEDLPENWPKERLASLRQKFRAFAKQKHEEGFSFIVLGHCHDFDEVPPYYFNMGYPLVHGQYVSYESSSGQRGILTRKPIS